MVNESQIPIFSGGIHPIGTVNGTPVASKKHAGVLMKRIMSLAKAAPKMGKATKGHKGKVFKGGKIPRRGIESDSKVHVGKRKVKWY